MDVIIHPPTRPLTGTLTVPADKAICHRAVLAALLADGRTTLRPWPDAEDCRLTLELARALGAGIGRDGEEVQISGTGGQCRAPGAALACGESGSTMRLAAGVLAGQPFESRLVAGPGLSRRPMRRIAEPLSRMGADISGSGAGGELYPPLVIRGRGTLEPVEYRLPVASAQVKSAVLLAALAGSGPSTVIEPRPTRDHTERTLARFGAGISRDRQGITIAPGRLRSPGALELPGDVSSAAFLMAAAAGVPESRVVVRGVGLNPTRIAWLDALRRMGARLEWTVDLGADWEPQGTLAASAGALRAVRIGPGEVPGLIDELPMVMALAATAEGTTVLEGLEELRVKETDRIQSMMDGLARMGARARLEGTASVIVQGGALAGGQVDGYGDHRTVMSLAVAALKASGPTRIRGAECVSKSFPGFFQALQHLAGAEAVETVDNPGRLC